MTVKNVNYPGTRFLSTKTEIARFSIGFRLNYSSLNLVVISFVLFLQASEPS